MTDLERLVYEREFTEWKKRNQKAVLRGNAIAAFLGDKNPEIIEESLWLLFKASYKYKNTYWNSNK